jgi:hypothetical protein
VIVPV